MMEIGGYIEFEHYSGHMLHEEALALNCGRNCLAYLFKSKNISCIKIPYFICGSIVDICYREKIKIDFYHVDINFKPVELSLEDGEWLYLVNFYGQLSNDELMKYVNKYQRVIIDQANGYFEKPLPGVDTFYTCRKWFGVADGAFLYTDSVLNIELSQDESFDRMRFLMGRFESTASRFYPEYVDNNKLFANEPIKKMSKLTSNLLRAVDYDTVVTRRIENFNYLHKKLSSINKLKLGTAAFMYPLMVDNGAMIRKKLQAERIYIPTLWPKVYEIALPDSIEVQMAENILPLPIDQRYGVFEMDYLIRKLEELL